VYRRRPEVRKRIRKTARKWEKRNPEKAREYERRHAGQRMTSYLRRKYNITKVDYDTFMIAQRGLCAICGGCNKKHRLSVDHCHSSGKVRGLLCKKCNTAIGLLKDSVAMLEKALAYLGKATCQ
jgi:hypothetical protein